VRKHALRRVGIVHEGIFGATAFTIL
jgi:hypothetical protein